MKSVLLLVSTLVRAGPNQQLLSLCKYLPEFGWSPHVITLSRDPQENLSEEFARAEIPVETLALSRLQGFFHAKRKVRESLQKLRPDVIHTSGIRSDSIGHQVSGAIPHVMTIRNFAWDDYPEKFGRIKGTLMAMQHWRLIKKSQMPVACSRAIARRLATIRPQMRAIPNGVDIEKYTKAHFARRQELRAALGLDPDAFIVLSVGSLIPLKNPLSLLNSFLGATFDRPALLIFLGDGPLRQELESRASGHDRIRVLGQVSNTANFYRCADLFASTSTSEGLPNSVLEAMACGIPVVLTDIEAHLEFNVDSNRAGATAILGNEIDFTRKLELVARNDWLTMSENAQKLAHGEFSARGMAERYSQLYSELGG